VQSLTRYQRWRYNEALQVQITTKKKNYFVVCCLVCFSTFFFSSPRLLILQKQNVFLFFHLARKTSLLRHHETKKKKKVESEKKKKQKKPKVGKMAESFLKRIQTYEVRFPEKPQNASSAKSETAKQLNDRILGQSKPQVSVPLPAHVAELVTLFQDASKREDAVTPYVPSHCASAKDLADAKSAVQAARRALQPLLRANSAFHASFHRLIQEYDFVHGLEVRLCKSERVENMRLLRAAEKEIANHELKLEDVSWFFEQRLKTELEGKKTLLRRKQTLLMCKLQQEIKHLALDEFMEKLNLYYAIQLRAITCFA
jgi:hypothetical protein